MPIPSSSSSPPQPLIAGSSSCSECTPPGCFPRPYSSWPNSGADAPDCVVALDWVAAVALPAGGSGKVVYQPTCFCPTSGMLDPLARPYGLDEDRRVNGLEQIFFMVKRTCSAAARVLNVTVTSPFSSVSTASTWPPVSYQSRTACTLSLPTSLTRSFLGRLSSFMLARGGPPRAPPR